MRRGRLAARGRDAESGVEHEYLSVLNDLHDAWLANERDVVAVDATRPVAHVADVVEELICNKLQEAIKAIVSEPDAPSAAERRQSRGMQVAVDFLADRVKCRYADQSGADQSGAVTP